MIEGAGWMFLIAGGVLIVAITVAFLAGLFERDEQ